MQRSSQTSRRDVPDAVSREKRAMEQRAASTASPSDTSSGRSFSTFLMDGVSSPVQLHAAPTRAPPPPLPPLRSQAAARSDGSAPRHRPQAPTAGPASRRRTSDVDNIPVLEAARDSSGFRLDGADQAELEVNSDEDEDGGEQARVVVGEYDAEEDDFVPVLQTAEDALRAHRHMGSKKFSWRASARRGVPIGRTVRVPDQETLLRMSARTTELSSNYSSGNSMGSRRNSSVRIDRELVRSGWLFKQANVMKTWKRRYFVLIKRTNLATGEYWASLQYYKGNNFGKLRGEMHLQDGMLSVRFLEPDETKRPFCFEVAGEDFSFVCSGSNDDDASAWVCLLQSLSGGGSSTMPPSAVGTAASGSILQSADSSGNARVRTTTIDARSIRIVAELRRVLHTSKSPEAVKFKNFQNAFECRSSSSLRQFREFHAMLTESIVKDHGARILTALRGPSSDNNGTSSVDKKSNSLPISLDILQAAVSRHVEEVLFLPMQDKINTYLRRVYHEDEASINRKVRWLQGKDQMYFNIPLHQVSWKEWRKASRILAQIAMVHLPAAKYDVLTSTIKEIQSTYAEEHDTISELEALETDDIIPIFTYVLSNSGLENLISLKTLLTELNGSWAVGKSPDDEKSLNILVHAVDFISNVSIPAVLEDIFKDQITLSIDGDWRRVLEFEVEPTYRYGAIVEHISPHGYSAVGTIITRGYVLVTVNGQNVVLWPFQDIMALLLESASPHRLAFIPGSSYFKILTSNKALWNVALMHACQRGDVFSVQMLLANGADVNYVAHECGSNTPLHVAVSALHFNVVSYMLQHGAKVKTIGEYGRSALHMVGSPCTMPATMSSSSAEAPKTVNGNSAAALSDSDKAVLVIKKLLAHGALVDTVDIYGNNPVMLLAERGYLGGIDTIMEADSNIDLNARNWQRGMSALALAAKSGRVNVVEGLLDYGAQVDIRTLHGETPLHFAAASATQRVCQLLIEKGCSVDVRTSEGLTPLMIAVARGRGMAMEKIAALTPSTLPPVGENYHQNGHHHHHTTVDLRSSIHVDNSSIISTMNYLVQSGADMSAVCEVYRMPLHYAAMYGSDELFACLLTKMGDNAHAERRDLYGESAMAMAEASRSSHAHVDENVSNDDGSTVVDDYSDIGEDDNDDSDDDDEDVDEVEQADIPMSLTGRKDLSGKTLSIKDLITEENDGVEEIIAGTFDAIADLLLRFENYRREELNALIWYCGYASKGGVNFREMVDILRNLLKRYSVGTEPGFYVRRMVLCALNMLVEILKHSVECDMDVCNYVAEFFAELVPLQDELSREDPQCAQWLSTSFLPEFVDACTSRRMQEYQVLSFCEGDYPSLKQFICTAKQANPNLAFLDDELFGAASGMEIITETMRRRMSLAGVWKTGEVKGSFVVKAEERLDGALSEGGRSTTITPWQPRGVNVGRSYPEQRIARLWILDLDPSIIAQQITLLQHYLFSKIKVSEVLASKRNAEKTPGYQRLRLLHNHISIWVVGQILMRGDVDHRAEILAYFIRVAGVLLSPLQNLDGFMAVMNAANDSSVFRLKKTWGRLPPQARDLWQELVPLTENGARPLNKLTKEATPPLIPYMGMVIQNVIALQEYPDRVEGDLINFKKIRSIGFLIQRMLSFQKTPYLLPTNKRVLEQICSSAPFIDAESCFKRSLKIEPRVADAALDAS